MAEEKIALKLSMVSVPADPAKPVYGTAAANKKAHKFNFGRLFQQICVMALVIALSIGCYTVISHYFIESVQVVGVSMAPTLDENGHYLLNRWAFHNRAPQAGDVVVLRDPADHGISVKRIVATGGQSVLLKEGNVFVNGREFMEPYLLPETHTYTYNQAKEQFITCGKDQFFVMGDNRLKSIDSRAYGPVPRENILGLVVLR
jgi:signal peptidase I